MTNDRHAGKLTLFLMTEKGFRFLEGSIAAYRGLFELVVIGADSSLEEDFEKELVDLCEREGVPYVRRAEFSEVRSEYAMAISWRWLVRHPADKLIVFHDSLLPRYRGFAPLVNSLINGEPEIGVSAIFGADDFDTGAIIAQSRTSIAYPLKIADAISLVSANYLEAAKQVLDALKNGRALAGKPQDEARATYSLWRDERDYQIDWSQPADRLVRVVHALGHPYQGAQTLADGAPVRILDAVEVPDVRIENRTPGKVLFVAAGLPIVVCGTGLLKVLACNSMDGANVLPFKKFRIRFGSH